jgi:hypothetical protein
VWDFHIRDSNDIINNYHYSCSFGPDVIGRVNSENCEATHSLSLIVTHLPQYVAQTGFEFVKFNFYPFPSSLAAYRNTLVWMALIAGVTMLIRRKLRGPSLWLFLFLATYVGINLQIDAFERHAMTVLPLYYGFAATGILAVVNWARYLVARDAPPTRARDESRGGLQPDLAG